MASLQDVERLADDLDQLVGRLRSELKEGEVDFRRLIEIADEISEHADAAAGTFATVDEALTSRLKDVTKGKRVSGGSSSSRSQREKSESKS